MLNQNTQGLVNSCSALFTKYGYDKKTRGRHTWFGTLQPKQCRMETVLHPTQQ